MAVACGATVANLYYAQPLLPSIAGAFGVSDGAAGLLVTVSQVCYAAGLVLLVPLGDLVDRRRLIVRLLAACSAALVLAAAAPTFAVLAVALGVAATASVVAQILVPFAGTLVPEHERGRIVGVVMSGALTGILVARTLAGLLAAAAGWRAPFVLAAAVVALLAVALWRALPQVPPPSGLPYRRLLVSIGTLVRAEPLLRRRMAYGALGFAGFTLAWTTVAFLLAGDPYTYGEETIGLFGLAGLVGALAAQGMGRLMDRGLVRPATGMVLVIVLASWGVLALGSSHVIALAVGLVLLDFGVQGQNVLSQGAIIGLGAGHASRVTTAYVASNFAGGAAGSAAAAVAWSTGGWDAVCAIGAIVAALAAGLWLSDRG
jgi:predicted MFS family arabinose efflux permease